MSTRESPQIREKEILRACEKLYEKKYYQDVTIKEISLLTSFSRPSIYNYFQSKEEIFLRLFENEYDLWCADLETILEKAENVKELPEMIARSLEKRKLMLKLISDNIYGNLYTIDENSRIERRISFERAYGKSVLLLDSILKKAFPERNGTCLQNIRNTFLTCLSGFYYYAAVTPKQIEMMRIAEVEFDAKNIYELSYEALEIILK